MNHTLERRLRAAIAGDVRFDDTSRALYSTAASNYRQVPIGVVLPSSKDDVEAAVGVCRDLGVPVLSRGGGTSLAGQCCNTGVVFDFSRYMNRIVSLDVEARLAVVEPGLVLDHLRNAAMVHGLTFGPDPSTHNRCTLGGMIGNNACGTHAMMAGKTVENVESMEVLTYNGVRMWVGPTSDQELAAIRAAGGREADIYGQLLVLRYRYAELIRARFPKLPRRVSGYNLDQLLPENGFNLARALVGTESTCVTVLEATVRLVPNPPHRSLIVLGYRDIFTAADQVPAILESHPIALEGLDDVLVDDMRQKHLRTESLKELPQGHGWLMVEFGGETAAEAKERAMALAVRLRATAPAPDVHLVQDDATAKHLWEVRESGLGATAYIPGEADTWEGWEDAAVPPEKLGAYLRDFKVLLTTYGYKGALYGHFGHGCVHTRISFDLSHRMGISRFRKFLKAAAELVVSHGGSLSGEHGDGQSKAEFLPIMFGDEVIHVFRQFKSIWDPRGKMNPRKVVDPYRADQNLRMKTYHPEPQATHFAFEVDKGDFRRTAFRCVGVGACRRDDSGTMCPSYRVTREEKHSTRGRAHLLFEMLQGEVVRGGWRDRGVKEALDLCLACKACRHECPVNVDMATYKAEFLGHYYARRLRPRHAYAMGLIFLWARLAAWAPKLVNFLTHAPGLGFLAKALAGLTTRRPMPRFAPATFRAGFAQFPRRASSGEPVILWVDTFNNHFHPPVAYAAAEVLQAVGYDVRLSPESLCCGRPLYDFGMLERAKGQLRAILESMRDDILHDVPVVGLEPSCAAVFRDELTNLFPKEPLALRLASHFFTLPEFLERYVPDYPWPTLSVSALVHGHCHEKSIFGMEAMESLLKKLHVDFTMLDAGCCGLAGAFGFEPDNYDVSMQCGERVLFPAVRRAEEGSRIVTNGFSCHEQIAHGTGREAMHVAELLRDALRYGDRVREPFVVDDTGARQADGERPPLVGGGL